MRVLVDVDGVLADFVACVLQWTKDRGEPRTRESITEFNIFKAWGSPELWTAFNAYIAQEGVCQSLAPMPGSMQFVERLRAMLGIELAVATSPYKGAHHWIPERIEWLEKWFGFLPDEVCVWSRKHWIDARVLIDDALHKAREFPGHVLLLDQPWNQCEQLPLNVTRCYGYVAVVSELDRIRCL